MEGERMNDNLKIALFVGFWTIAIIALHAWIYGNGS